MERKAELVTAIKAICGKMNVRPALYESLQPQSDGRIEITVACNVYLEDEHDDMIDQLNDLTYKDTQYVISPCGSISFGGGKGPESCGMKRIN